MTDRLTDDAVEQLVTDWIEYFDSEHVERIELLQRRWDELATQPEDIELTHAQRVELDRRLDDYRRHPSPDVPWECLRDNLRSAT